MNTDTDFGPGPKLTLALLGFCQLSSIFFWFNHLLPLPFQLTEILGITLAHVVVFAGIGMALRKRPLAIARARFLVVAAWILGFLFVILPGQRTVVDVWATLAIAVAGLAILIPTSILSLPQPLRDPALRLAHRCLGIPSRLYPRQRMLPRMAFTVAIISTLIAAFYTIENVRWSRKMENYRLAKAAEDKAYDSMIDIAPPQVPDSLNFAMTPLLQPILDYDSNKKGTNRWRNYQGFKRLQELAPHRRQQHRQLVIRLNSSWYEMRAPNFEALAVYYRGKTNFPAGSLDDRQFKAYLKGDESSNRNDWIDLPLVADELPPGETVRRALSTYDPEFAEIAAALERPHSRFPIHYDHMPPYATLLPHLSVVKRLALLFRFRASASLAAGHLEEAFTDTLRTYQLADTVKDEPFLISHLVRMASQHSGHNVLWEGMRDRRWTADQLLRFQRYLEALDLRKSCILGLAGERVMASAGSHFLESERPSRKESKMFSPNDDPRYSLYIQLSPAGWFTANRLATFRYIDALEQALDPSSTLSAIPAHEPFLGPGDQPASPKTFIARAFAPHSKLVTRTIQGEMHLILARVACALERFYLSRKTYPPTLQELVPDFLASIPIDHTDGKPLRYQRSADGRYRVYSIGANMVDDGGRIPPKTSRNQGDWVWAYEAEYLPEE